MARYAATPDPRAAAMPPPIPLQPSRYYHDDTADCSHAKPSPTCHECFRYFCSVCGHGVGGMFGTCYNQKCGGR